MHDPESLRLELQESLQTFRHWTSQWTQAEGFIIAGDVALLSYGFAQKLAVILLLAIAFPVGILLIYLLVIFVTAPQVRLILKIEQQLHIGKDSLGITYIETHLRPEAQLRKIEQLDDEKIMPHLICYLDKILSKKWWLIREARQLWLVKLVPIMAYMAIAAQIALFVLSLSVFHYPFMAVATSGK
jgi:hypothetical protein